MFVIPAEWKHPMHGSPRVQAFPAPSYLFPGAGRVASAHFHPQALVPEDQDLLGVLHGLGLAGKSVPVVRRPLHIAEDDDHCWRWDRPSLRSCIPSLVPASSRVLQPPVATLPSCGNKLIHPRMRGGDGGKEPRKEGTPNSASLRKIAQAITEWRDGDASLLVQWHTDLAQLLCSRRLQPQCLCPALQYFIPAPPSYINHAINRNRTSSFRSFKPTKLKSPTVISGSWDNSVATRGEAGFRQE